MSDGLEETGRDLFCFFAGSRVYGPLDLSLGASAKFASQGGEKLFIASSSLLDFPRDTFGSLRNAFVDFAGKILLGKVILG